jgi:hypothetical protein
MSDNLSRVGLPAVHGCKGAGRRVHRASETRPHTRCPPCGWRGTLTALTSSSAPVADTLVRADAVGHSQDRRANGFSGPLWREFASRVPQRSHLLHSAKSTPRSHCAPRLSRATHKWQYNEGVKMKLLGDSDEVGGREAQPACGFACCRVASVHCFCSPLARRCRRSDVFGSVSSASQTTFPQFWAWAGC